jgi:hypothetical protein
VSDDALPVLVDLPARAVDYCNDLFNDTAQLVDVTANLLDRLDNLRGFLAAMNWNDPDEDHWDDLRAAVHIGQVERLFHITGRLIESATMGHGSDDGLPDPLDGAGALGLARDIRQEVGLEAPFSWGWSAGASSWADVVDPPWPDRAVD